MSNENVKNDGESQTPTALDNAGIPFARMRFCIFVVMVALNISGGSCSKTGASRKVAGAAALTACAVTLLSKPQPAQPVP